MRNILGQATEGARAIIVGPTRGEAGIGVELTMMNKPKEGFASWDGRILPNAGGEGIIRQVGEGELIEIRSREEVARRSANCANIRSLGL